MLWRNHVTVLIRIKCGMGKLEFARLIPAVHNSANILAGALEWKGYKVDRMPTEMMIDKVIPAIMEKWPMATRDQPIFIQHDNAPYHLKNNDAEFVTACGISGLDGSVKSYLGISVHKRQDGSLEPSQKGLVLRILQDMGLDPGNPEGKIYTSHGTILIHQRISRDITIGQWLEKWRTWQPTQDQTFSVQFINTLITPIIIVGLIIQS